MTGFTVKYTEVIKTELIQVICNKCSGECVDDEVAPRRSVYLCRDCGTEHDNPTGVLYSRYKYTT